MSNACYRSSVSRSYYSAYGAVSQALVDRRLTFAGDQAGPAHRDLRVMVENNIGQLRGGRRIRGFEKKQLKAAINLLYETRLDADYRPTQSVEERQARDSLIAASRVTSMLGVSV